MHAAMKKAVPVAASILAAATLSACVVEPVPYYGGTYYAAPATVYVGPRHHGYYGPHRRYWHGGGHWH